ncbi:MAG TPA: DUF1599 domain-containing protein [Bacteroidales bacterium]|nr:DUF1599 domain-containing protein [Bacteroidales bacterium]HRZ76358.1 DUF1599 domain-containing protein [Bacteroidales bacterium]
MEGTSREYQQVINRCREVFSRKMSDYGLAWRVLRPSSLTDQIYIKASRIRSIETKGEQRVKEGIVPEFIGMVNYSIMALVQLRLGAAEEPDLDPRGAMQWFDAMAGQAQGLMEAKNHDYGEAWRQMRVSSLTDIILMKLHRIKQIEDNEGRTEVSEGTEGSYADIINYSVFALIKLGLADSTDAEGVG